MPVENDDESDTEEEPSAGGEPDAKASLGGETGGEPGARAWSCLSYVLCTPRLTRFCP